MWWTNRKDINKVNNCKRFQKITKPQGIPQLINLKDERWPSIVAKKDRKRDQK